MTLKNKKQYIFKRIAILTITLVFITGTFTPIVGSQNENLEIDESIEENKIKLGNKETISKTSSYENNQESNYSLIKESSLRDKLFTLLTSNSKTNIHTHNTACYVKPYLEKQWEL